MSNSSRSSSLFSHSSSGSDVVYEPLMPEGMTAYLWLSWYHTSLPDVPKHWVLSVSYDADEDAFGTIYHATSDSPLEPHHHELSIRRGLPLDGACDFDEFDARLFLGFISDSVIEMMELYAETATELLNAQTLDIHRRTSLPPNCQDWCLAIVQSLEDAGCLEHGTLQKAAGCPRFD